MQKQINLVFIYLTILVFLFLLIPGIFQEGLFMDGLIYSTTGNNMARSVGSFWNPSFTRTIINNFDGHPPLAIYLQSIFFKVMGDGYFVEKIYSFITACITALLIISAWFFLQKKEETKQLYWLPVLLWITIPVSFWAYQNNMLENTLGIFTLGAFLTSLYSINSNGITKYCLLVLSSALMVLGFLSKGFPAFFPLAVFIIHWTVYRRYSFIRMLTNTLVVLFSTALIFLIIFWNDGAATFLIKYLNEQVIESIKGNKIVDPRYFIIVRLFRELMAPFLLFLLILSTCFLIKKEKKIFSHSKEQLQNFSFLFLTGLSASLPIAISPKQMGFYLLPALPLFVLAIAVLIAPLILAFCSKKINSLSSNVISVTFCIGLLSVFSLAYFKSNNPIRDKELIKDVKTLGSYLGKDITIDAELPLRTNWPLVGYLQRYYYINIDLGNEFKNEFMIVSKNSGAETTGYALVKELKELALYKKVS